MRRALEGRRALVTGATGGLGLAIAGQLAAEGCEILLHGLAEAVEGAAVAASLAQAQGVAVAYRAADLRDPGQTEALMRAAGEIDILVNNAASRHFAPVDALPRAAWDADIAVNLSAAFDTIRLALPGMRRRGWGRIVNMSSIYGLIGAADRAGYVTTKTALLGLTRAVALETARQGITCNALCPGTALTPGIEARVQAAMQTGAARAAAEAEVLAGKQPSGRFVQEAAVAGLVGFLCSEAAGDITGAALPVDGGWSIS
ncbi:SDR family NAD(P)-dependent oxidoreductase [Pseudoroseomonas cervicalis]|uniref:SDR family NAD(P)-dependent oxidoreductase n=1 Tax=Teichococcus cervicalis TaxID=204525 RepID=UPI00278B66D3|nr:SDR family NAD(P)-dependent oxidoreductase [Pseudoroseomonas cervicalis]MDQ1081850.1 3-hydroxybutyrate dehydrogenase [Pseudoroseomonas cervicalis]